MTAPVCTASAVIDGVVWRCAENDDHPPADHIARDPGGEVRQHWRAVRPTPGHVRLLRHVAAGRILVDPTGEAHFADGRGVPYGPRATWRWSQVQRCGWARRPDVEGGEWLPAALTEAGARALASSPNGYA